jgi:hypothetical protein
MVKMKKAQEEDGGRVEEMSPDHNKEELTTERNLTPPHTNQPSQIFNRHKKLKYRLTVKIV